MIRDGVVPAVLRVLFVAYVLANFTLCTIATVVYLVVSHTAPLAVSISLGAAIVVTLIALGALLESKPWARTLELIRVPAVGVAAVLLIVS